MTVSAYAFTTAATILFTMNQTALMYRLLLERLFALFAVFAKINSNVCQLGLLRF